MGKYLDMINVKNRAIKTIKIPTIKEQLQQPKTCIEFVYETIRKKRQRTSQLYETVPQFNTRTIRESITTLRTRGFIKKVKCECGLDSLWEAVK